MASRTGPPTSASSSPAAANRAPSSSVTGAIRASSATTRAWTSAISRGSSDTREQSMSWTGSCAAPGPTRRQGDAWSTGGVPDHTPAPD